MKIKNKGFTLVELVVAFTITLFIIGGVMYFFSEVIGTTTNLATSSDLFTGTENIKKLLENEKAVNPYFEIENTGSVNDERGADILLLEDDAVTPTAGILFGVYDESNDTIVIGDITQYNNYKLFYKELDAAAVAAATGNLSSYTTSLTIDDINIIPDINLIKFGVSELEGKIKTELRLTPVFYKSIVGEDIGLFENNSEVESYYISFLN